MLMLPRVLRPILPAGFLLAALAAAGGLQAQTFRYGSSQPMLAGFGNAVAVSAGEVFVAESRNSMRPGLVYIYHKGASGWGEAAQLKAAEAADGDGFGSALAVDGRTLVVGATTQMALYVFTKTPAGAWRQVAKLSSPETSPNSGFGNALAVKGDVLLAGVAGADDRAGAVYVYRRDAAGTWSAAGRLPVSDLAAGDQFGATVAFDGAHAAVGAPFRNSRVGAVYLYAWQKGEWGTPMAFGAPVLGAGRGAPGGPPPAAPPVGFGAAVQLDGDHLFVGAPVWEGATGAVFAYRWEAQSNQWVTDGRLLPFDGAPQQLFGTALAAAGNTVWVGAPASFSPGSVYIFSRRANGGLWSGVQRLTVPDTTRGQSFANAIALGADVAVVGAMSQDHGAGTAVIYDRTGGAAQLVGHTIASKAEALAPIVGGKVDCTSRKAKNLFDCNDVDLLGFLPVSAIGGERGINLNDDWGWTDPETGKEYALVGRTDGAAFVDISNPSRPVYVGQLMRTPGANVSAWRDIKTYKDHAYIVSDGAGDHGMQVFDLTKLRQYKGTPISFKPDTVYHNIHSAHNIVINEESGYAYAVGSSSGGETCGGGLHMIDIRDPDHPKFAGCFSDPQTGRSSTGYTHDAQCVMYHGPDRDYQGREICLGSNETMLSIADVTDKQNPKAISRIGYPNVGYTHQGWLTDDQRYFLMDDELDEIQQMQAGTPLAGTRTLIWDLSDLDDPQLMKEFLGATKASDHNLYIKGNLVFESDYAAGLRILDISDIRNPVEVAFFDTSPFGENMPGFSGSWSNYPFFKSGNVAVTSIREGLFIVKKRPTRPVS